MGSQAFGVSVRVQVEFVKGSRDKHGDEMSRGEQTITRRLYCCANVGVKGKQIKSSDCHKAIVDTIITTGT